MKSRTKNPPQDPPITFIRTCQHVPKEKPKRRPRPRSKSLNPSKPCSLASWKNKTQLMRNVTEGMPKETREKLHGTESSTHSETLSQCTDKVRSVFLPLLDRPKLRTSLLNLQFQLRRKLPFLPGYGRKVNSLKDQFSLDLHLQLLPSPS